MGDKRLNRPIPVSVVTGFLGSGKTTLLTSLIQCRKTRRLAILINEFGEISIDGAILRDGADRNDEIQMYDFANGLIAYGADGHFIQTMQEIAMRCATIDHVLVETSGLALPTAVMEALQGPVLANDFILDATLVVVDTPLLLSGQLERHHSAVSNSVATLFEQQLENADVVVLNKIDQLDDAALLSVETRVRKLAPNVRFLELAHHGKLDIRVALGLRLHQPTSDARNHRYVVAAPMPGRNGRPLGNQWRMDGHVHSGLGAHLHGVTTHKHFHEHDPGWLSFILSSEEPQEPTRLQAALVAVAQSEPVLRSKGYVRATNALHSVLVQGVRSRVTISVDLAKTPPDKSALVFIGYHLSRENVAAYMNEITGTQWT